MRQEILSVSKAKAKLLSLVRSMEEEGRAYILTKDGEPVGAMIPMIDFESFLETDEIMKSENLMRDLRAALKDEEKGRVWKRNKQGHWIKAR
jgi:prevent-host-death family protein